jgi:hypothetical protein
MLFVARLKSYPRRTRYSILYITYNTKGMGKNFLGLSPNTQQFGIFPLDPSGMYSADRNSYNNTYFPLVHQGLPTTSHTWSCSLIPLPGHLYRKSRRADIAIYLSKIIHPSLALLDTVGKHGDMCVMDRGRHQAAIVAAPQGPSVSQAHRRRQTPPLDWNCPHMI